MGSWPCAESTPRSIQVGLGILYSDQVQPLQGLIGPRSEIHLHLEMPGMLDLRPSASELRTQGAVSFCIKAHSPSEGSSTVCVSSEGKWVFFSDPGYVWPVSSPSIREPVHGGAGAGGRLLPLETPVCQACASLLNCCHSSGVFKQMTLASTESGQQPI